MYPTISRTQLSSFLARGFVLMFSSNDENHINEMLSLDRDEITFRRRHDRIVLWQILNFAGASPCYWDGEINSIANFYQWDFLNRFVYNVRLPAFRKMVAVAWWENNSVVNLNRVIL